MNTKLLTAALASCISLNALGAGFQVNVQGVRQLAMAGGGTAIPWDAATILYNPGGLARLKNIQAYGSAVFLMPRTQYAAEGTSGYTAYSKAAVYTPFNVYVGGPWKKDSKLAVGLGIYTPFGSGMTWDDNWAGRYVVRSISLQSIFIQPTVSYKLADWISVGGGFVYGIGYVDLQRAIPLQNLAGADGKGELEGNANGIGYNLGVHLKPHSRIDIGLSYRSEVKMKVKNGKARFQVPSSLSASFPNTSFEASVPLPQIFSVGVGVRATEKLTVQLDVNYVGWSAYDTLGFDYKDNTTVLKDTREPRSYQDKIAIRLGGHYQWNPQWAFMLGTGYDPSPVKDGLVSPDLPDANRWLLCGGVTYKASDRITILSALEYGVSVKRKSTYTPANFNGTYQTKALVPTIGITYDFQNR